MTRSELVQKIMHCNEDLNIIQAEKSVNIVLDEISSALSRGYRVELRGFGVFTLRTRLPRLGRNPRTGEAVDVDAKQVPFFKAGKSLKDRLNS